MTLIDDMANKQLFDEWYSWNEKMVYAVPHSPTWETAKEFRDECEDTLKRRGIQTIIITKWP
jgi:hypothetical protein